jgi:hypothetical protein
LALPLRGKVAAKTAAGNCDFFSISKDPGVWILEVRGTGRLTPSPVWKAAVSVQTVMA